MVCPAAFCSKGESKENQVFLLLFLLHEWSLVSSGVTSLTDISDLAVYRVKVMGREKGNSFLRNAQTSGSLPLAYLLQ